MVYLVLGLAFIGLECWRLVGNHPSGPLMPLWGRIPFPLLIAAGAFRFKGCERNEVVGPGVSGTRTGRRHRAGVRHPAWGSAVK